MAGLAIPQERKQMIIEDTKESILQGATLLQVARKHGIAERTLAGWLAKLPGTEYSDVRQAWIDDMLWTAKEHVDDATDNIQVARAREQFKVAVFYAERLDSSRYGQQAMQSPITINLVPPALQASASLLLDSISLPIVHTQVQESLEGEMGGDTSLSRDVDPPG